MLLQHYLLSAFIPQLQTFAHINHYTYNTAQTYTHTPIIIMGQMLTVYLRFFIDMVWIGGGTRLNPVANSIAPYTISASTLDQLQTAMDISFEVQWRRTDNSTTSDIQVYRDVSDKTMVAYRDGTCYVAWMGAVVNEIRDIGQSTPRLAFRRACGAQGCCRMHPGMINAYYSEYVQEMEESIERCVRRCDDADDTDEGGGCPLVITGHSQGASIAPIGAVILAKYNPILMTFGQHRVHRYSCDVLDNMETYLRVVSICEHNGRPAYDMNTYYGTMVGRHTGTMIIVGDGGAATLGYNSDMAMLPLTERCHNIHNPYASSIQNLTAGPLDGFVDGSMCTRNIECKSRECKKLRCTSSSTDDAAITDNTDPTEDDSSETAATTDTTTTTEDD